MGRRVYVKGKKTHAKGESFTKGATEKERYQVSIDLISLKTLKDYDSLGRVGEFYFKIDGEKMMKARFPDKGVIKLQKNQSFTSKSDMNLWTQFKTLRSGKDKELVVTVILREQDKGKKDQTISEHKFKINLPQKTEYIILQDKEENTKAKLRITSVRTRY